jgi:hypothetical protein
MIKNTNLRPVAGFFRVFGLCCLIHGMALIGMAQDPAEPKLIPVEDKVIQSRVEELKKACDETRQLVAYLDCGTQRESVPAEGVKITWVAGKPYRFASEAADVPETLSTVAFDESRVVFEISGLDPQKQYEAGVVWWDYDDGQRTQMVTVASPDRRQVQMAIPAARLPNFKNAKQKPESKKITLPVRMARDGKLQLLIQPVTGPNAVVSEIWVVEKKA